MTDNPETIGPDGSAEEVVRFMRATQCRHLPIVENGRAIGMVFRGRFQASGGDATPNPGD
jgi:CBS domain-containing protein